MESILNSIVPIATASIPRPTASIDQLALYLQEGTVDNMGLMDYWKSRESEWPQLTAMAYDFLSIPAISSECERVFSSCAKQTTAESSNLLGITLAHQECLSNWHRRGAIKLEQCWGAVSLA
jgi:hypothetical protein